MSAVESLLRCTFCEKSQTEVAKLIAGPGVYICNHCVALCNDIIEDEGLAVADREPRDAVSEETLLAHLGNLTAESDELVEHLRARGVAWERIAASLGRREGD